MNKLSFRTLTVALGFTLAATMSAGAFAKGKESHKEHGDKPVIEKVAKEVVKAVGGAGSAVGAGLGVFFTPSKIGCGEGEQCR